MKAHLYIGVLLLCGCASEPPALSLPESGSVAAVAPLAEYHVGPGDVLQVSVFRNAALGAQTLVDETGHIQLPLVGLVQVNGMSPLEIRETVTEAFLPYLKKPSVFVTVETVGSQRYIVLGEAGSPGVYPLRRPLTALEALATAGGFSPAANREQVVWMRGGIGEKNLVMLDGSSLDAKAAMLIQHGDVLYVSRRAWADRAEVIRDIIPLLQAVTIPLSIATQFVSLERLLND
jgi:protein involved in polysaccharide export with SLBB domain